MKPKEVNNMAKPNNDNELRLVRVYDAPVKLVWSRIDSRQVEVWRKREGVEPTRHV